MLHRATTSAWASWRSSGATRFSSAVLLRGTNSIVCCGTSSCVAAFATTAAKGAARHKKSILVDGNNVLYHYYNPLQPANRDGVQREAVDGLIQLLQRMDKTHLPEHVCVFFDSKRKPTMRKLIDPTYKSLRKPTPQSLGPQLASAAGILHVGGVNCISEPGYEADDLIASYTEAYVAAGYEVLVVSNDNDFLQLARGVAATTSAPAASSSQQQLDGGNEIDNSVDRVDASATTAEPPIGFVELYQPNKRRYVRERHVQSRFGLPHARLVPAFLALVGTRWGKIQKVEHMTDERAVALLAQYGSLPALLRNLNAIDDPALRKSLKHAISSIETSLRIAQLNNQITLPLAIADMAAPALERLVVAPPPPSSVASSSKQQQIIRKQPRGRKSIRKLVEITKLQRVS